MRRQSFWAMVTAANSYLEAPVFLGQGHAVAHLHAGPGICHRDLNADFIVQDVGGSLVLKLTEFELAALQKPLDSRIINNGLRK